MTSVSRSHQMGQFGSKPTIQQKIEIFQERVAGWQIDVAEEMARQFFEALAAKDNKRPMRECGFAIVSVIFSYFETIAQYLQGASSNRNSFNSFQYGFRDVYPACGFSDYEIRTIYAYIRCGMYHNGMTRPGVNIFEGHKPTFAFDVNQRLLLNPFTLVSDVKQHFLAYIGRLQNPADVQARHDFEKVFDWGVSSTDISMLMGSGSGW